MTTNPSFAVPRKRLTVFSGRRWTYLSWAMFWCASPPRRAPRCRADPARRFQALPTCSPGVFFFFPDAPVHILLLNEYFPPDTSATAKCAAQVADALTERHRVTVLAGRPSYDSTEYHPRYLLRREVRGNLV